MKGYATKNDILRLVALVRCLSNSHRVQDTATKIEVDIEEEADRNPEDDSRIVLRMLAEPYVCPKHGKGCIPYALKEIERLQSEVKLLSERVSVYQADWGSDLNKMVATEELLDKAMGCLKDVVPDAAAMGFKYSFDEGLYGGYTDEWLDRRKAITEEYEKNKESH